MMRRMRLVSLFALSCLTLGSCRREERRFHGSTESAKPESNPYQYNAYAISQGKTLFSQFNCSGCHANGGGGMGPPLMDDKWIYGSAPQNIYETIVEGRPNGMPAWRGKIPSDEVWQLVAYVRSMSGQASKDAASGRDDHMFVRESEQRLPELKPKKASNPSLH